MILLKSPVIYISVRGLPYLGFPNTTIAHLEAFALTLTLKPWPPTFQNLWENESPTQLMTKPPAFYAQI